MSKFLTFNLNDHVLAKLLPQGFVLWHQHFSRMPTELQLPLSHYQAQIDAGGYSKFQAWEFMQIFGPHISLATTDLFEATVILNAVDLKLAPALPLPLITDSTWQLSCKSSKEMAKAWECAAQHKVPMWAGLATDPEDRVLEFHAGGLWDSLEQDPSKRQVTLAEFQKMCQAYK